MAWDNEHLLFGEQVPTYLDGCICRQSSDRLCAGSEKSRLSATCRDKTGIGPKQDRTRVLDKAWNSINTNQFGTNEYMAGWALVEYCNTESGTKCSDLRRKHGYAQPYNVKH